MGRMKDTLPDEPDDDLYEYEMNHWQEIIAGDPGYAEFLASIEAFMNAIKEKDDEIPGETDER